MANYPQLTFRDCKSGGWQWRKSRVWNPERADILWLAMSVAYARMLSLGAKVCLSPKIHRAAVGGNPDSVNVFMLGLILFQDWLWNRRRIPCALKLPTGLRAAKSVVQQALYGRGLGRADLTLEWTIIEPPFPISQPLCALAPSRLCVKFCPPNYTVASVGARSGADI